MADIKGKLTSNWGLQDKLRLLSGGDNLQLPEIGDLLTLKILEDIQIAKSGKTFLPLKVTPVVDNGNKERFAKDFDLVEGNEYKFFIPLIGREHVSKYMKEINPNLTNSLLTIEVKEWKDCPPDKIAERDLHGRAKSAIIIRIEPDSQQALDDALAQVGNTTEDK